MKTDFDAVVVGSGPNGLAAAITLQQAGLSVLILEGKEIVGGGMRSGELTLPGFVHDICSTIHPMAADSPVFEKMPLKDFGLEFLYPAIAAAHLLDNGDAVVLANSIEETAAQLGIDADAYKKLFTPLLNAWPQIRSAFLAPLHFPKAPFAAASFGIRAILSAEQLAKKQFKTLKAHALIAGMAAHSMLPLNNLTTSAIALVLMLAGHNKGWPVVKGGSQQLGNALAGYFKSIGGNIETSYTVTSLKQLPSSKIVMFDTSPQQLLQIAGHSLSAIYRWQLKRYQYGMGVFKIDWALSEAAPFTAAACRQTATVHIGNTMNEIIESERLVSIGKHAERPFIIFAQPSIIDPSRAPEGKHTGWAYCHVPNGSTKPMTEEIEKQVERFAPGFKDCILARSVMNTGQLEAYNPNYIGGDINGGKQSLLQLFTRPALRLSPYKTSAKGIYICSASTPPGGGVHGIAGYYAARRALKDIFKIKLPRL